MMGKQADQPAFLYDFALDKHVPADHMLRSIDRFVELDEMRVKLAPFYSPTGRPSIDPDAAGGLLLRHPFGTAAV
jgi:transposase